MALSGTDWRSLPPMANDSQRFALTGADGPLHQVYEQQLAAVQASLDSSRAETAELEATCRELTTACVLLTASCVTPSACACHRVPRITGL